MGYRKETGTTEDTLPTKWHDDATAVGPGWVSESNLTDDKVIKHGTAARHVRLQRLLVGSAPVFQATIGSAWTSGDPTHGSGTRKTGFRAGNNTALGAQVCNLWLWTHADAVFLVYERTDGPAPGYPGFLLIEKIATTLGGSPTVDYDFVATAGGGRTDVEPANNSGAIIAISPTIATKEFGLARSNGAGSEGVIGASAGGEPTYVPAATPRKNLDNNIVYAVRPYFRASGTTDRDHLAKSLHSFFGLEDGNLADGDIIQSGTEQYECVTRTGLGSLSVTVRVWIRKAT